MNRFEIKVNGELGGYSSSVIFNDEVVFTSKVYGDVTAASTEAAAFIARNQNRFMSTVQRAKYSGTGVTRCCGRG